MKGTQTYIGQRGKAALKSVLDSLAEVELIPLSDRKLILIGMPQTEEDCRLYSQYVMTKLFRNLVFIEANEAFDLCDTYVLLKSRYEDRQYRAVQILFMLYFLSVGISIPPLFVEFALDERLLDMLLRELLACMDEYIRGVFVAIPDDMTENIAEQESYSEKDSVDEEDLCEDCLRARKEQNVSERGHNGA